MEEKPPAYNPQDPAYPGPPPPDYGAAQGYPPAGQPAMPPQQPGGPAYPPQQPGGPAYPPQQPGGQAYPQQQGGPVYAPQQQPGYPPQQQGYPQQPAGYPPQQPYPQGQVPPPGTTVVVGQPTATTIVTTTTMHMSDRPTNMGCPNCHNQVTTVITRNMGGLVWLIAAILCIVGLWPCCLIPFCITDLYDCEHHCPVCKYHLGSYRRL